MEYFRRVSLYRRYRSLIMLIYYRPSLSDFVSVYWKECISGRGNRYRIWSPAMPRIDDLLLRSVFYIYMSKDDAVQSQLDSATGFFVGIPCETGVATYAITNRHIIEHEAMETPTLRVNSIGGGIDTIETAREKWRFHPLGSDLAICLIELGPTIAFASLGLDFFPSFEFMKTKNIGVGDDVFMIGNFQTRGGRTTNLPMVRFGNIAQMPVEPMMNPHTGLEEESFIVEMRSASGFSGSPVIVFIPWLSNRMTRQEVVSTPTWHPPEPDYQMLLGIDWGHIRTKEKLYAADGKPLPDGESIWINSAMAGVVPSWKLTEMLFSEEEVEMRRKEDERKKKKREQSEISVDFDGEKKKDDKELTQEKSEDVLKKISRPLKKGD